MRTATSLLFALSLTACTGAASEDDTGETAIDTGATDEGCPEPELECGDGCCSWEETEAHSGTSLTFIRPVQGQDGLAGVLTVEDGTPTQIARGSGGWSAKALSTEDWPFVGNISNVVQDADGIWTLAFRRALSTSDHEVVLLRLRDTSWERDVIEPGGEDFDLLLGLPFVRGGLTDDLSVIFRGAYLYNGPLTMWEYTASEDGWSRETIGDAGGATNGILYGAMDVTVAPNGEEHLLFLNGNYMRSRRIRPDLGETLSPSNAALYAFNAAWDSTTDTPAYVSGTGTELELAHSPAAPAGPRTIATENDHDSYARTQLAIDDTGVPWICYYGVYDYNTEAQTLHLTWRGSSGWLHRTLTSNGQGCGLSSIPGGGVDVTWLDRSNDSHDAIQHLAVQRQ